jgi:hypothetical protein
MKNLQEFLLMCSGANQSILKRSPSDLNKHIGLGGTILFTAIFASLAAAYAIHLIFENVLMAAAIGLVWGLMIFNLDRFIVSSMKHKGGFVARLILASPRIVMAVVIAMVMSTPIELRLFESEIETELVSMQEEKLLEQRELVSQGFDASLKAKNEQLQYLDEQLKRSEENKNLLVAAALAEADGTGGSQRRNMGPIYQLKQAAADQASREHETLRVQLLNETASINSSISLIEEEKSEALGNIPPPSFGGIAGRIEALDRLGNIYPKIEKAHLFIFFLFLMIECCPLLVKLITSRSPYDHRLNLHELSAEHHARELSTIRQHDLEEKLKYHTQITTAQMNAQIKLERAKIESELQSAIKQWQA